MVGCMAVMARERWTDGQLDKAFGRIDGDLRELRVEMKKGFEQVDQRFEQIDQRFEQVDQRFKQVDQRFDRLEDRFGRMELWMGSLCCTIIGSLIAAFALQ
jgi:predicted nuclease with TOPRIM domain